MKRFICMWMVFLTSQVSYSETCPYRMPAVFDWSARDGYRITSNRYLWFFDNIRHQPLGSVGLMCASHLDFGPEYILFDQHTREVARGYYSDNQMETYDCSGNLSVILTLDSSTNNVDISVDGSAIARIVDGQVLDMNGDVLIRVNGNRYIAEPNTNFKNSDLQIRILPIALNLWKGHTTFQEDQDGGYCQVLAWGVAGFLGGIGSIAASVGIIAGVIGLGFLTAQTFSKRTADGEIAVELP